MKFQCIKGMSDNENVNIVVMQGDIVKFIEQNEGEILVEGLAGWCNGFELCFTPKQFVEHFQVIGLTYTI